MASDAEVLDRAHARPMDAPARPTTRIPLAAGIGAAACLILAVMTVNVPTKAAADELRPWWSATGNQVSLIVSMFLLVAAALLVLALMGEVRTRLPSATGSFVHDAAMVHAAGLGTAAAARGVVGRAVVERGEPLPDVDMLRHLSLPS